MRPRAEARSVAMNVVRIEVPIGVARGTANAWLLPDPPVTLVDCGPNLPQTADAIVTGLRGAGLRLDEIEQILLTHGHVDHAGFAGRLAELSGARVFVHPDDLLAVRDPLAFRERRARESLPTLVASGVPTAVVEEMRRHLDETTRLVAPAPRARAFPGTVLDGGGTTFDILPLRGHTPGSVAFHAPRERALFTGDGLLQKIVTGAVEISPREEGAMGRHLHGLEQLLALPPSTCHPGHGVAFPDVGSVIARDLAHHARRSDRIRDILRSGPRTAWEIVESLFLGHVEPAFAVSEVLGHLRLFEGIHEVARDGTDAGGAVRWRLLATAEGTPDASE
jgi:glyoxylase-like metal-dependent hydrolase (beta-lactamase superfamily II)